jgi:hypothetical protein
MFQKTSEMKSGKWSGGITGGLAFRRGSTKTWLKASSANCIEKGTVIYLLNNFEVVYIPSLTLEHLKYDTLPLNLFFS